MFGMDGTNDLLFSICAKQVGAGLEEQLKRFVQEHPDTKLISLTPSRKSGRLAGINTATPTIMRWWES